MKEIICIACPKGCHLTVDQSKAEITVTGNECKRGETYGIKEVTNPTRIVTSTVKVVNSQMSRCPVVTDQPVPKEMMFEIMDVINSMEVKPPIAMKQVLKENLLDTWVNLISSKSINK